MEAEHHRHDIPDRAWELLKDRLPGQKDKLDSQARDNRQFYKRRHLDFKDRRTADYGDWKNTHRRFCRWRDKGVWEKLFKLFVQDPDFEWLMIDASYIKVHPHAAGAVGGSQAMGRTKGGSTRRYTLRQIRSECLSVS